MKSGAAGPSPRHVFGIVCLTALSLVAMLCVAEPASAATVMKRPLIKTFDGSDTTAGKFSFPDEVAVYDATGTVYVTDSLGGEGGYVLDKFNAAGEAQSFSAVGKSSFLLSNHQSFSQIAVDSSGANPGQIYVATVAAVKAVNPAGEFLPWELKFPAEGICGLAVDAEGHLWVSDEPSGVVKEFASTGSPPAQIGEVEDFSGTEDPCKIDLDFAGNLFIGQVGNEAGSVDKYIGGSFDSVFDPFSPNGIAIDQSKASGLVFVAHNGNFIEYEADGTPIWSYGEGVNGEATVGLGASDITYHPGTDRVYLLKGGIDKKVFVFGPPEAVGTAPDLTIDKTTSGSLETAHISGTINPLGLENSYHFEYKEGNQPVWTFGVTSGSTGHVTPPDSATHEVSLDLSGLKPFTQYQVRLVATNDATGVKNISRVDRFRTGKPAVATICDPSEVTAHTVHACGTVDPKESKATWRFQTSPHPECLAGKGFSEHPLHTVEANSGPTAVEETLSGLIASQDYCVRIAASNSPGTAYSAIKEFTTLTVPPTVEGRGAAPRTETSARLNAFVNPENAPTTYRFEYSADGGATWTPRPNHLIGVGMTTSILVSEEFPDLEPGGAYLFRIFAENSVGSAQGEPQGFTTLSEPLTCPNEAVRVNHHTGYLGACRGLELVNEPDKGNQNVVFEAPRVAPSEMTADGNEMLWQVLGGAPGGPSGAFSTFLAQRTGGGWRSRSVTPPAPEQFGGGALVYFLRGVTPDVRSFVFGVRGSTGIDSPPPPTMVRIRNGVQDVLKTYAGKPLSPAWEGRLDLTDDGAHALFIDPQTGQLEDIGAARVATAESPAIPGEVVSIMPNGSPNQCGLEAFAGTNFADAAQPGYHWIGTDDASRVYFLAKPNLAETGAKDCASESQRLYVRNREANGGAGETIEIDPGKATFLRATPDGRHAYFLTASKLDPADINGGQDVYRWGEEADESICLTCLPETEGADLGYGGATRPPVLVSDDFSHVYFASENQLVPGHGRQGEPSLFALSGGEIHFVGAIDAGVFSDDTRRPALSADGNVLLFVEKGAAGLTADAVASECGLLFNASILGPCTELYRYDDRDHSIECLSCDHDGTTTHTVGTPVFGNFDFRLSGDGSTAGFATAEVLLPTDVNNDTDIYEWRKGAVHLVTDGVSVFQESFSAPRVFGLDDDGSDLFFAVVPPGGELTGFERDSVSNLYDARIDGGFEPPPPPEECDGDSCQGPLQAAPPPVHSASAGFNGRGSLNKPIRPPCRRGKVRRHGRCVSRHRRKNSQKRRAGHVKPGRAK